MNRFSYYRKSDLLFIVFASLTLLDGKAAGMLTLNSPMPRRITATRQNSGKTELTLATFINYGGLTMPMGSICTEGIKIALDAIQKASLLTRYEIVIDANDDRMCENGLGVNLVANLLKSVDTYTGNLAPLMVGPTCMENAFTGHFIKYHNFVGLCDASIVLEHFTNRQKYDSFNVIVPTLGIYYDAIPAFLKSNGWSQVYLLTETFTFWIPLEEKLQFGLERENITLAGTSKLLTVGETLPSTDQFEMAVGDLAAFDPRIVIVNSHFTSYLACFLYRYRLHGPGYVFLVFGPSFFLPNSAIRAEGCTDKMIASVLESSIFFSNGTPINLDPDTAADVLGTTGKAFEASLKEKIDKPDLNDKWFFWRTHCYDEVVAAALALNITETKLNWQNDTLLNWKANSDNFQRNGSYIQSLLREAVGGLKFKGLNTYEHEPINGLTGKTGFFQMQLDRSKLTGKEADLTAAFKTVPVATYDTSFPLPKIVAGPGVYLWRTLDGHAPYDSLRILPLHDPIYDKVANGILIAIASVILVANFVIFVINIVKSKTELVSKSLPQFNAMILLGNMLVLCFVFIIPVEGDETAGKYCFAASVLLVAGFSLIVGAIIGKLEIGYAIVSNEMAVRKSSGMLCIGGSNGSSSLRSSLETTLGTTSTFRTIASAARERRKRPQSVIVRLLTPREVSVLIKRWFRIAIFWAFSQFFLAVIWFAIEPPSTERVERELEHSKLDPSLAYQHFTYACKLNTGSTSIGFIATLIACYSIVVIRSLYDAFFLRKSSRQDINDLHLVRVTSYAINLIVIASGAVIYPFFGNNVAFVEIALSTVAVLIVLVDTILLFANKIRKRPVTPPRTPAIFFLPR